MQQSEDNASIIYTMRKLNLLEFNHKVIMIDQMTRIKTKATINVVDMLKKIMEDTEAK